MKRWFVLSLSVLMVLGSLSGCATKQETEQDPMTPEFDTAEETYEGTKIQLSDDQITVDGAAVSQDTGAAVYTANDIVYYESGKDFTYGEGEESDAHTAEEAAAHTVVHITKPGQYVLSGKLSKGQIAVDLGEDAEEDPSAVVTLVLNEVEIRCDVAPAVIFYNVYECGSAEEETATKDVDTTGAGARVIIANNSKNTVVGSHVARIYKPGTVELTEDGTEVADAKKLHKYDAAFYSKMTMTVQGGNSGNGNGTLSIMADNEGLDSELHLTINGGDIKIESGNDGINTNEDNVSVTTINGGRLSIYVNGSTGEGDGIDSNGWLVINGGVVLSQACGFSGDAGIDSDKGIHINGGIVVATGNMLDRIEDGGQTHAVFTLSQSRQNSIIKLKNADNDLVIAHEISSAYTYLVISSPHMTPGDYTLWDGDQKLEGYATLSGGGFGGNRGEMPDGFQPPEGMEPPSGERPGQPPEGFDGERPERPDGMPSGGTPWGDQQTDSEDASDVFPIQKGANYFKIV